jgi:L-amino acid N-acyltransferase YncA
MGVKVKLRYITAICCSLPHDLATDTTYTAKMNFSIRPVTIDDAAATMHLLNAVVAAGNLTAIEQPVSLAEQQAFIATYPPDGLFFVALSGDELVGMQDIMPDSNSSEILGEVSTFVGLDKRGQGVGSQLSAVTFQAALQRGFKRLHAKIRADNAGALRFYQLQGFLEVARETAVIRGTVTQIIISEKALQ